MYDNFAGSPYVLADGQVSPNRLWKSQYNGYGQNGVKVLEDGANAFVIYPQVSTSFDNTSACLVTTTQVFTDTNIEFDIRTEKQLRKNDPPKGWECGWIFFRYTDGSNFYYFTWKPEGIELGKTVPPAHTGEIPQQVYLVTVGTPKLPLNTWTHWKLTVTGNRIQIWLNGTKYIDYTDTNMTPILASGVVGMYCEDSLVDFRNMVIDDLTVVTPPTPPTSPTPASLLLDNFALDTAYTITDGKNSPNGQWNCLYAGYGSTGVKSINNVKVFELLPKTAMSKSESHSALVQSILKCSDFTLDTNIRTVKQLRQITTPNPWEVGQLLFRYTNDANYYVFILKTNGFEFNRVYGGVEKYLVNKTTPKLTMNTWNHVQVSAVGNHFKIWLDGILIVDYVDSSMPAKLASGSVVMYGEDSQVNFGNMNINAVSSL
jgi:hypothetical protein